MKKLNFTFGMPDGRWNAALPQTEEIKFSLVKHLNENPQNLISITGVPEFILLGYRNFEAELNNTAWHTKKTLSGAITVPSNGSSDFNHLIKWQAYPAFAIPLAGIPHRTRILISPTIKEILEKFNLFETQFIPVTIRHELTNEKRTYYVLNAIQDLHVHYSKMHWPSMEWSYFENATNELIAAFGLGSMDSAETFWKELDRLKPTDFRDLMKYEVRIPQFIYAEAIDALMLSYGYIFTEEIAEIIKQQTGMETVIPYQKSQIFTGNRNHE